MNGEQSFVSHACNYLITNEVTNNIINLQVLALSNYIYSVPLVKSWAINRKKNYFEDCLGDQIALTSGSLERSVSVQLL